VIKKRKKERKKTNPFIKDPFVTVGMDLRRRWLPIRAQR
jgi:hypothetical protein